MPLTAVGTAAMSYGEAVRLTGELAADPSSHVACALMGWEGSRSVEWLLLADLYDAFGAASFKSPKLYPRPFRDPSQRHFGKTDMTRAQVIAVLNAHGHQLDDTDGSAQHG
jgi:hypothetical protein